VRLSQETYLNSSVGFANSSKYKMISRGDGLVDRPVGTSDFFSKMGECIRLVSAIYG
jgi:hypothetical protein